MAEARLAPPAPHSPKTSIVFPPPFPLKPKARSARPRHHLDEHCPASAPAMRPKGWARTLKATAPHSYFYAQRTAGRPKGGEAPEGHSGSARITPILARKIPAIPAKLGHRRVFTIHGRPSTTPIGFLPRQTWVDSESVGMRMPQVSSFSLKKEQQIMASIYRFGRRLSLPSTRQIKHELRMLILAERVEALQKEATALKEFNAEASIIKAKEQIIA
jgi:hypothetical protein